MEIEPQTPRPTLAKRVRRLALIVPATYLVVCLAVAIFQKHLIYFPQPGCDATPADVGLAYEDVSLTTSDGVSLAAWYVPAGPADAKGPAAASVIFCHGNAGNISNRLHTIQVLHNLGMSVLIFDYRGYGLSKGSPSESGTYADAEAAWAYLTGERAVPPKRIILMGRSLGGAVAIELASRHTPGALVVESTFTRLADVAGVHYPLLPSSLLTVHRYDSIDKVPTIDCPKLFLHGRDDQLIPPRLGRSLYEAAAEPKRFIETPGGHNAAGFTWSQEYTNKLADFVREACEASGR